MPNIKNRKRCRKSQVVKKRTVSREPSGIQFLSAVVTFVWASNPQIRDPRSQIPDPNEAYGKAYLHKTLSLEGKENKNSVKHYISMSL